ncbi:MAG TPA: galactokinase [Chthoniobacterales bacterium]|nr:galactokinase [Chthoniobacterales bacterium]
MRVRAPPASASAYAPGRVELLGNHTDYNQGVVLAAAIDRGITISGRARNDDVVTFTSNGRVEARLSDLRPREKQERWANYPLGVIQQLQRAGFAIRGFDAQVSGDVPVGAGLSSSAAFEVATAGFIMKLHGFKIPPLELAKLCQRAENEFVGVKSGLLDQATSVFGRADHLVYLDFQTEEVRTIPFPAGFALVIADSGVKHSLIAGEYNARREECAAAAKSLGVATLREVTLAQLREAQTSLDSLLYRRALHIVGENDRVWRAVQALRSDNAAVVGQLMNDSHESSRVNFENSTLELDALTAAARSLPGVLGSRLTGGGFGGGTVSLVRQEQADEVVEALRAHSRAVFMCRIADGAGVHL